MQTGRPHPVPSRTTPPRILVTGALGQIGSELVVVLRSRYGNDNVFASDIRFPPASFPPGPFLFLDVENRDNIAQVVLGNRIDWVVHLVSLLSATGEKNPQLAMKLNTRGIENVLEVARTNRLKVFAPSTIAVFGPTTPKIDTPDLTIMKPTTIYGVTKVYLELLGEYYYSKYGVDFRSIRYPGVISSVAMPGGGTTDYATEIYHEALKTRSYQCFLRSDSRMPMLYMPDCLDATIHLLEAPNHALNQRVYNVTGLSFTPSEVAEAIKKHIPDFSISYSPDFRQAIADSWPSSIDDSHARRDWGWRPSYDLDAMTAHMLQELKPLYQKLDK